jgi:hypothetical protein
MSTGPDVDERELERQRFVMPGRVAGRMVDGVDIIIDEVPAGRMPPRWVRKLTTLGYDPDVEGPITYVVEVAGIPAARGFPEVRPALLAARWAVEAGHSPREVEVRAVTRSGRSVSVVTGTPIIGMAIGATEDPPITVIEGPSVLPEYAPDEKRPKRHRRRHRRQPGATAR